jgi:hypothetical protein
MTTRVANLAELFFISSSVWRTSNDSADSSCIPV